MSKKALLMILDGWGLGNGSKADIISNTPTPYCEYSRDLTLRVATGLNSDQLKKGFLKAAICFK